MMSTPADEPAQRLSTELSWDDLTLGADTLEQVREIEHRVTGTDRTGYSALFYGPPGTGKTLTATLLGKQFERDVYRIDLSQVVSKYIGETEKSLEELFEAAERKDWVLFFDEADDLFGKRTDVRDSHDRYRDDQVAALARTHRRLRRSSDRGYQPAQQD